MLKGSVVALVTPMDDDGVVDFDALVKLLHYQLDNLTHGMVILGTTGEPATITLEQQLKIIDVVVNEVAGQVPLYIGNGGNSTAQVIERSKVFEKFDVEGFLSVVPYYNNPSQKGLLAHFSHIANSTDKAIMLYNVPGRTVADMLPETVEQLAKIDNIIGIKEATGDLQRSKEIRSRCGDDFILLSGDDASSLPFLRQGGDGMISVTANLAPRQMALLYEYAAKGDFDAAKQISDKLSLLHQRLFIQSNPVPAKWGLYHLGIIDSPQVRLPLVSLEPIYRNAVKEALEHACLSN